MADTQQNTATQADLEAAADPPTDEDQEQFKDAKETAP